MAAPGTLPEGWAAYQDPEGRTYYANVATGESSYEAPAPPPAPQASALPEGWAAYTDAEGRTYYANVTTGETSWETPAAPPGAVAAAAPGAPSGVGQWSVDQAYELGEEGEEYIFQGKVPVLDRSHGSVASTVEALNMGALPIAEGYCVVFSKSKQRYYLLWRDDKEDEAFAKVDLSGHQQQSAEEPWSTRQVVELGPLGSEESWNQRVGLLDQSVYNSVSDAVAALNSGTVQVDAGLCVVFSGSRQNYFLLYRADKSAEAEMFP